MKRNSVSCGVLSAMDGPHPVSSISTPPSTPIIEETVVYLSKVPVTQVYQCMNKLPAHLLTNDDYKDLATCIATPHDPVDREERNEREREVSALQGYRAGLRNNIELTLSRYQYWWERVKKQKGLKTYPDDANDDNT